MIFQKCDCVFFSKTIKSEGKIIQRISRALRTLPSRPDKRAGNDVVWCDEYDDIIDFMSSLTDFDTGFTKEKVKIVNYDNEEKGCVLKRKKKNENSDNDSDSDSDDDSDSDSDDDDDEYADLDKVLIKCIKVDKWMVMFDKLKKWYEST